MLLAGSHVTLQASANRVRNHLVAGAVIMWIVAIHARKVTTALPPTLRVSEGVGLIGNEKVVRGGIRHWAEASVTGLANGHLSGGGKSLGIHYAKVARFDGAP